MTTVTHFEIFDGASGTVFMASEAAGTTRKDVVETSVLAEAAGGLSKPSVQLRYWSSIGT